MEREPSVIRIANAPVSYGVFELSRPEQVALPNGEQLASWVAEAGYAGIDLGPVGLLGTGDALVDRLRRHRLELAGGWMDFPFAGSAEAFDAALAAIDETLDIFVTAADTSPSLPPLPTIACSGSAQRKARPGGAPDLTLRGDAFKRFAERVQRVADRVRRRGLEPTFHHHACTYVETPEEIDALLASTDIGLTFDSGHLLIGGGTPLGDFRRWRDRINHLHLKDARTAVLADALATADPMRTVWERRVFVPLGDGDLAMEALLDEIVRDGFHGWLVVEQDVILASHDDVTRAREEQFDNREKLRRWFS